MYVLGPRTDFTKNAFNIQSNTMELANLVNEEQVLHLCVLLFSTVSHLRIALYS